MKDTNIKSIPAEKFAFVSPERKISDEKFETKQIGYFADAWHRFCKNKSSVVAAVIILILVLYAIFVPMFCETSYSLSLTDTTYLTYTKLLPKSKFFSKLGFWDGTSSQKLSEADYLYYAAMSQETGRPVITKVGKSTVNAEGKYTFNCDVDSYTSNGMFYLTMTRGQYDELCAWQNANNMQVIFPAVNQKEVPSVLATDANIWFECNQKGVPKLKDGKFVDIYKTSGNDGDYASLRIPGDPGIEDPTSPDRYRYAQITGDSSSVSYNVRICKYTYFIYRYGFEPSFLFGTNDKGQDIFTRLAAGARFSFLLAISISVINLFIGSVYGAIEGYYGGAADMIMERFSDILNGIPFMVVATLFQLHMAKRVGVVGALLFAFVLTGWIGMASSVRMQFYRFKGQEYILAARTLGARDMRLMFKHIFPNSLGTLITGSVLVIPGVIFSESSLTYLGVINLDSSTMTSVGTMLANGRQYLSTFPHIIFFPSLFISLLEISFNLFGNGLRDAFNPALRGADD